ncbi:MAG: ABC transporter substrate-binding protein [Dehalococcoidia bacterium]
MSTGYGHRPSWPSVRRGRRQLLAGTALSGAAALALAACGGGGAGGGSKESGGGSAPSAGASTSAGTAGAGQVRRGGTYLMDGAKFTDVLDPHRSQAEAAGLFAFIGNQPLRISADGKNLEPTLVEKWEIPGDGTEIILKTRAGVKWHNRAPTNGRPFTAEDLGYNLQRIAGKLDPSRAASYQRRSTLPNLDSVSAVDDTTLRVKLSAPHSGFLRGMAHERNYIIPKDLVDAQADKWNDPMTLVGTGPWMFESYQKDVKAVLKPNPDYWEKGKPYLDSVEQSAVPDRLSALSAFSQGKINQFNLANKTERDTLSKTVKDAQAVVWTFANWTHFRFNMTRRPFTDVRVRQALQLVFDYKQWADAYYGDGFWEYTGPLATAFPEAIPAAEVAKLPGWNPATKEQDIKKAKDLMTAAGYPDGNISFKLFPSTLPGFIFQDDAVRAQDTLKRIWPAMDVTIDIQPDYAVYGTRQVQGDFDVLVYVIYSAPDAVLDLADNYHSNGSRNYGKFKDTQIDQLLDKAAVQLDNAQRTTTLKDVQDQLINKHMYVITTDQPKQVVHVSGKVKGLENAGRPFGGASRDISLAAKDFWLA